MSDTSKPTNSNAQDPQSSAVTRDRQAEHPVLTGRTVGGQFAKGHSRHEIRRAEGWSERSKYARALLQATGGGSKLAEALWQIFEEGVWPTRRVDPRTGEESIAYEPASEAARMFAAREIRQSLPEWVFQAEPEAEREQVQELPAESLPLLREVGRMIRRRQAQIERKGSQGEYEGEVLKSLSSENDNLEP